MTTKAQVVGKGDVSMDPAGNITVTWKNGDTNKPGPDEAVENVKTFLKAAGWKGDITVTKQGVKYVFTGKDSYGWDAQATWDTANNFYEVIAVSVNGTGVEVKKGSNVTAAFTALGLTAAGQHRERRYQSQGTRHRCCGRRVCLCRQVHRPDREY